MPRTLSRQCKENIALPRIFDPSVRWEIWFLTTVRYARYGSRITDNCDFTHSWEIAIRSVNGVTEMVKYPTVDGVDLSLSWTSLFSTDNKGSETDFWDAIGSGSSPSLRCEIGLHLRGSLSSSSEQEDSSSRSLSDR